MGKEQDPKVDVRSESGCLGAGGAVRISEVGSGLGLGLSRMMQVKEPGRVGGWSRIYRIEGVV